MFGDVQHTIRDAQYRDALSKINESPPERELPKPSSLDLENFSQELTITLETVLDSPIGIYYLKEYLNNFLNITIIIDFLMQYQKVKNLEDVTEVELKDLVFLADALPAPFKSDVTLINQQLKIMEEGEEYQGLEANDLVLNNEADPFLVSRHFDDEKPKKTSYLSAAGAKVLKKIRIGKGIMDGGVRVVSFGGNGTRISKKGGTENEGRNSSSKKMAKQIMGMLKGTTQKPKIVSAVDFEVQETLKPNPGLLTTEVNLEEESNGTDEELEDVRRQVMRESVMDAKHVLLNLMEKLGTKLEKKANQLFETFRESKEYNNMIGSWWFAEKYPVPGDFRKFRMLGRGAFGVVSGVKHKYTGQLVAMKMMNKRLVKGKRALPLVHAEKEVLQILGDSPSSFTIWLKYAFQDADYYYMAIPLCTGGDLSYHLSDSGTFSIERVRFYAAEIFEGLAHLHHLGIIYRDLKPENVILDSDGHCRISDMGLAAVTNGQRIKSKAGTPGYWAPEVLVKLFYSYAVDIWSLGVVIFEMVIGVCPFSRSNTGMDRDKATRYWPIKYPEYCGFRNENKDEKNRFPDDLKSLLKGLLKRRASKRFNEETIRAHPFFSGIDWEDLRNRRIKPPFIPTEKKINAGAAKYLEERGNEREFKRIELTAQDNIKGFDYISKYAHELDIVNVLLLKKDRPDLVPIDRIKSGKSGKARRTTTIGMMKSMSTKMMGSSSRNHRSNRGDCVLM